MGSLAEKRTKPLSCGHRRKGLSLGNRRHTALELIGPFDPPNQLADARARYLSLLGLERKVRTQSLA